MRSFTDSKLVLATHNKGKIQEISDLLAGYVQDFPTAASLNLPEPEETEDSYAGNAVLKARSAMQESCLPALADDSGLSVYALNGAPGIYSARWAEIDAEPDRNFQRAMERVNDELGDHEDRRAAFVCVLALVWPDDHVETFEGRCEGTLIWPSRGNGGFGYDSMFVPEGYEQTFGEMAAKEKQKLSHRAKALRLMFDCCFQKKMSA